MFLNEIVKKELQYYYPLVGELTNSPPPGPTSLQMPRGIGMLAIDFNWSLNNMKAMFCFNSLTASTCT